MPISKIVSKIKFLFWPLLLNYNLILGNLRSACLAGADLERATLVGSDLQEANLRGVNFKDADLNLMLTPLHMSQAI